LAEQSKQSTAEVRHMLTEMQQATNGAAMATELGGKAVDSAIKQSQQAGRSIAVLAASVQESALAAKQIAVSNNQQLAGVDQVAHAMSGIQEASSEHLQAIRHVEIAAHRLNEIGIKLKGLVDRYDVWDLQSSSRARAETRLDTIQRP
jgi:methyl-accepting chemotaxis protein